MLTLAEFYIRLDAKFDWDGVDPTLPPEQVVYLVPSMHLNEIREWVGSPADTRLAGDKVAMQYQVTENGEGQVEVTFEGVASRDNFLTHLRILPPPAHPRRPC